MGWRAFPINNKERIRSFLEGDRVFNAYALGDLQEPYWDDSEFIGAELNGELRSMAVMYFGFDKPVVLFLGNPDGIPTMMGRILREGEAYLAFQEDAKDTLGRFYAMRNVVSMWRMSMDRARFKPRGTRMAQRLGWEYSTALKRFYSGRDDSKEEYFFSPSMLENGIYYGIFEHHRLVSAAGTHILAMDEGVGAVGNVYTLPEHRGKGYGTAVTSAVTKELLDMGLRTVVLNVARANKPAVKIYERIGYRRYRRFFEGSGVPR